MSIVVLEGKVLFNFQSNITVSETNMIEKPTANNKLVEIAKQWFDEPTRQLVHFTGDNRIDEILNDLVCYPHAYVLTCLMDRQIKAERAQEIPYRVCAYFNTRDIQEMSSIPIKEYV